MGNCISDSQYQLLRSPSGLINDKEICYMNSMVQALASCDPLIRQYEDLEHQADNDKLSRFVEILHGINQTRGKGRNLEINSEKLKELIQLVEWNRSSQQDAFQMLSFVINNIQKDISGHLVRLKNTMPPKLQLLHEFSENSSLNRLQEHLAIAVPLTGEYKDERGVDIKYLLDAFFKPSIIDDGPHTTSMSIFGEAPDVMILHIQANEWNCDLGMYVKPKYHINYEEKLKYNFNIQMKIDGSEPKKIDLKYRLVAVVQHIGDIGGGHYVTYRRHGRKWYLTNDEQVEKTKFKYGAVPYIMVYEKSRRKSA